MSQSARSMEEEASPGSAPPEPGPGAKAEPNRAEIDGDRGIASVNQPLALQFRLSNLLAIGLMLVLGLGFLTWYYAHAFQQNARVRQSAQSAVRERAQGEMALPSLGRVDPPNPSMAETLMGPPPPLPSAQPTGFHRVADSRYTEESAGAVERSDLGERAADRRLAGPVFSGTAATVASVPSAGVVEPDESGVGGSAQPEALAAPSAGAGTAGGIGAWLHPTVTPAVRARLLPTQQMLLPKGAFIDCTLETAIDSSLPGLTTCVTATDTFGSDGKVVLLERGTKLIGETRGEVQQGVARIFVLWSEARTPTGVVVPLASPGTDELGRSGLPGAVNRHFLERFGAAILVSVIDGAVQSAVQSGNRGGTVVYSPSASQEVLTGILKSTLSIAPTVVKRNGDRIQILVARDLDFRAVYELHSVAPHE